LTKNDTHNFYWDLQGLPIVSGELLMLSQGVAEN
jgi:hypothetical protein|tara:strand:- start:397 stop:498 length:102 start_codon:yes stop_codon:yes gene_type:complete